MRTWLVISAIGLWGCSQPVVFQGQGTLPVQGTPPARVAEVKPPPRVEVRDNKIEIHEKIQFEVNKATILEASFSLLNEIGDVIKKATHAKKIAIEGHASSEGDKNLNLKLSDARAKAVMKYLVDHGIEKERLTAKGYGSSKPIADNATEEGKEKNRRVEFNIIEQAVTQKKVEIDTKTGKEKVVEEKQSVVTKEAPPTPAEIEAAKKAEAAKAAAEKKAAPKAPAPPALKAPAPPALKAPAPKEAPKAPATPAAPKAPAPATSAK